MLQILTDSTIAMDNAIQLSNEFSKKKTLQQGLSEVGHRTQEQPSRPEEDKTPLSRRLEPISASWQRKGIQAGVVPLGQFLPSRQVCLHSPTRRDKGHSMKGYRSLSSRAVEWGHQALSACKGFKTERPRGPYARWLAHLNKAASPSPLCLEEPESGAHIVFESTPSEDH